MTDKLIPEIIPGPCPPHIWGDGPSPEHRACVKCGHIVKLEWVEPYLAPPLPEDEIRQIQDGSGIIHVPTGLKVQVGEDSQRLMFRPQAQREELARKVEAHRKAAG